MSTVSYTVYTSEFARHHGLNNNNIIIYYNYIIIIIILLYACVFNVVYHYACNSSREKKIFSFELQFVLELIILKFYW